MINHVFISFSAVHTCCISYIHLYLHQLRVHQELTRRPTLSWLESSVGRTLYQYRRGHGFEFRSRLIFFYHLYLYLNGIAMQLLLLSLSTKRGGTETRVSGGFYYLDFWFALSSSKLFLLSTFFASFFVSTAVSITKELLLD